MISYLPRWVATVAVVLTTVLITYVSHAQAKKYSHDNPFVDLSNYKWTNETWKGDDRPFIKVRQAIDLSLDKTPKEGLGKLVENYRTSAQSNPLNSLKQFSWGYVAYRTVVSGHRLSDRYHELQDVSFALDRAKSPLSYEYSRLRFLVILLWRKEAPQLRSLGQRLLRRNPSDYSVNYRVSDTLNTRTSATDRKLALSYAQSLVQLRPERASALASLGAAYVKICLYDDNIAAGDKAVAAYRKYFQLQPQSPVRRDIQHWINEVREHQTKLSKF